MRYNWNPLVAPPAIIERRFDTFFFTGFPKNPYCLKSIRGASPRHFSITPANSGRIDLTWQFRCDDEYPTKPAKSVSLPDLDNGRLDPAGVICGAGQF
jgi:hypothetical protein